jgi:hypothetical protein
VHPKVIQAEAAFRLGSTQDLAVMDTFTDIFEQRKGISTYWHNKASDLYASAGVLWAAMEDPKQGSAAEQMGLGQGFAYSV